MNFKDYVLKQSFNIALGGMLILVSLGIARVSEWMFVVQLGIDLPKKLFYYIFLGFTGAGVGYAFTRIAALQKRWKQDRNEI